MTCRNCKHQTTITAYKNPEKKYKFERTLYEALKNITKWMHNRGANARRRKWRNIFLRRFILLNFIKAFQNILSFFLFFFFFTHLFAKNIDFIEIFNPHGIFRVRYTRKYRYAKSNFSDRSKFPLNIHGALYAAQ